MEPAGPDGVPNFWLSPADGDEAREAHLAFRAGDRQAVDAVYAAAAAAGVEVLHAPREWPEHHPGYYGVHPPGRHTALLVHHGRGRPPPPVARIRAPRRPTRRPAVVEA